MCRIARLPLTLVASLASLVVLPSARQPASAFKVHAIDAVQSETAAVADLNNDRRLDIISAESWYEAPTWTKHPLRSMAGLIS